MSLFLCVLAAVFGSVVSQADRVIRTEHDCDGWGTIPAITFGVLHDHWSKKKKCFGKQITLLTTTSSTTATNSYSLTSHVPLTIID